MDDSDLCAVEGCQERGRPQICVYDGAHHRHGGIHYENGHPFHPELRFRPMSATGWLGICHGHYAVIVNGANAERARRAAAGTLPEAGSELAAR